MRLRAESTRAAADAQLPPIALDFEGPTAAERAEPRPFDVAGLPGATVRLSSAWTAEHVRLDAVCVTASTAVWVPGLEATVLDAASAKVRAAGEFSSLASNGLVRHDDRIEQAFAAEREGERAVGRHLLGFLGDARDLVVCTAVCTHDERGAESREAELTQANLGAERCAALLASERVSATFVAAPSAGPFVRTLVSAAEHPQATVVLVGAVSFALVAWLLARRPRTERVSVGSASGSSRGEEAP